jgi:hypothetical protein
MTKSEIIQRMLKEGPRRIFATMRLGGNARQLRKLVDDGTISSAPRYRGSYSQCNWYMTEAQHAAALAALSRATQEAKS